MIANKSSFAASSWSCLYLRVTDILVYFSVTQPDSCTPSNIPPHPHPIYTKVITKYKTIPGPGRSRRLRFPEFLESAHEGGKVVRPTHRPPLPPRRYYWYSCLIEAESTPGPYCGLKDYVNEKSQLSDWESNPRPSVF